MSAPVVMRADLRNSTDVAQLARLIFQWRSVERDEVGLTFDDYLSRFESWVAGHLTTHEAFVIEDGGAFIGMAWLALVDRVAGPVHFVRRCAYVQSVFVDADRRNQELGRSMLEALIERSRELGLDYIAVHPSERSFPFYERLGFSATARVLELDFRTVKRSTS